MIFVTGVPVFIFLFKDGVIGKTVKVRCIPAIAVNGDDDLHYATHH